MNKWREEIMGNMYRENQIEKDRQREREREGVRVGERERKEKLFLK